MDIENAKIVNMYERLFAEEGWKELMKDLADRNKAYKDQLILNPSNEKDLFYVKGYIAANMYLIELENMMETARNHGMLDEPAAALPDI